MITTSVILVTVSFLLYALVSRRLQGTPITAPMVFVTLGILMSSLFLGLVQLEISSNIVELLVELTLALVLFTDATRIDLKILRREFRTPLRLLGIGLPAMVILGTLSALVLFPGTPLWEAALLAAMLAPTDAALGQAVVSNKRIPVRVRQALNVESGLNDGLALPLVLMFLSLAVSAETQSATYWILFSAQKIIVAPIVGALVGWIGGQLIVRSIRKGWMSQPAQRLASLALALLAFSLAEALGGAGLIAVFVAGLALGGLGRKIPDSLLHFAEAEGQLLSLITFFLFGAVMFPFALDLIEPSMIIYAVLSLALLRPITIWLSTLGGGLQRETVLFLGWFGPRGLASIFFALLVLEEKILETEELLFAAVTVAVFLSVYAHGATAGPAARRYGELAEEMKDEPGMPEMEPMTEMPVRVPYRPMKSPE